MEKIREAIKDLRELASEAFIHDALGIACQLDTIANDLEDALNSLTEGKS